ncbi:ran-binding protein 9 [Biomphalaria pfeifferi]|uniref:Ran-binding protein 9 n=1 Tax=Biomphalaria pfeifferi TaxID=112525 RepID=A0AAD8B617_BIOPF|nr:ran-binding protein 9 [Biomphalaria pfeifferi]
MSANKMATGTSSQSDSPGPVEVNFDRLKVLYPAVDEDETPLPRSWSPKDKFNFIGLGQNNLRVHYKGVGKKQKDAASVRATHPIPAACGIYYFEVKVISKGRDGYMGIGLSAQGVNMNRLPGWDKQSYGYHGDDGNSFCSSGAGQPYGPTFTTGDTIGCCVNLIEHTCFYTKNGVNLGIAFTDLPPSLYPTVGLQTPGEVVEANFGQFPFVFDIEDYKKEWKHKTKLTIERFPVSDRKGEFQSALHRIVSTYLVHHGYCSAAEAFSKSTDQPIVETIESIKNRQRIQKLVLEGRMGEAIETTQALYPNLLDAKPDLLFMLKCRQFVEMVNGTDSEVRGGLSSFTHSNGNVTQSRSPKSYHSSDGSNRSSPAHSPHPHVRAMTPPSSQHPHSLHYNQSYHQQTQQQPYHHQRGSTISNSPSRSVGKNQGHQSPSSYQNLQQHHYHNSSYNNSSDGGSGLQNNHSLHCGHSGENLNSSNTLTNTDHIAINGGLGLSKLIDSEEMDLSDEGDNHSPHSNGTSHINGNSVHDDDEDMDIDVPSHRRQMCGGNEAAIEKMLAFGRELKMMSQRLRKEFGKNENNKKALQDAFSLLAYSDPWNSPIGSQLLPVKREPVCAALNSAILESKGLSKQPPLELTIGHTNQCMRLMSKSGIGACAFASVSDYLH